MYPALKGIEDKYGPTKVHLQLYDGKCTFAPHLTFPAKDTDRQRARPTYPLRLHNACQVLLPRHRVILQARHRHATHDAPTHAPICAAGDDLVCSEHAHQRRPVRAPNRPRA